MWLATTPSEVSLLGHARERTVYEAEITAATGLDILFAPKDICKFTVALKKHSLVSATLRLRS